jgi:hypothetical protein
LRSQRFSFATFMLSVGLLVFGFGATGAFIPVVAMRQMGVSSLDLGNAMGIATFVSAGLGLLIANVGMKWLAPRLGPMLPVRVLPSPQQPAAFLPQRFFWRERRWSCSH